jgi:ribosome-associated toxin RatA of RatAB toxin-antitoxin module
MAGTQRSIEIDAPPKKVFDAVTDFDAYPSILKEVAGIRVLEKSAKTAQVEMTVSLIKKFTYLLDFTLVAGKSVKWTLHEKGFFRKNDGEWILEPLDKGKRTKATYVVDLEIPLAPKKILETIADQNLPKMLEAWKKYVEGN